MGVLLAVSSMAYEYFDNIAVLNNMRLIIDRREIHNYLFEEKIELSKVYASSEHQEAQSDFFLVVATDNQEQILDVIQKNINYVKVLSPSSGALEMEIVKRFEIFQKNAMIQIERDDGFNS